MTNLQKVYYFIRVYWIAFKQKSNKFLYYSRLIDSESFINKAVSINNEIDDLLKELEELKNQIKSSMK